MEAYYHRITGKTLPTIMEMDIHERPLQKNNILCIIFEETSHPSHNNIYKVLFHPHPDGTDFFYALVECGDFSQSLQRHIGNLSLVEIKTSLIVEKIIPHGAVFIACSSSQA